jgi:hypothetical protein
MKKDRKVELEIYKTPEDSFGLTLLRIDENECGSGYRIFGPKLYGQALPIRTVKIDETEIDQLIEELIESKKFLINKKWRKRTSP